jgi:hypothetical protein
MPKNRHVLQVSTSTVLTSIHNTILCNQSTPITLTLPLPTANGINYKINRNDNVLANTVTLNAGVNLIINGTASSNTFIISPQTYTEITSLDNKWYITYNVLTNPLDLYGIFSTTFVANNTTPYMVIGGNSLFDVAFISYSPVLSSPSFLFVTLSSVSGTTTGNFTLSPSTGPTITTLPILMSSTSPISIFTSIITGFPPGSLYLRLSWVGTSGANDKVGLSFARII